MKYAAGFFGWFDRRLIQTEDDQDVVRRKLIDSDFTLTDKYYFGGIAYFFVHAFFLELASMLCLSMS